MQMADEDGVWFVAKLYARAPQFHLHRQAKITMHPTNEQIWVEILMNMSKGSLLQIIISGAVSHRFVLRIPKTSQI